MTALWEADRRLFFRATRAKIDAVVAVVWALIEVRRALEDQRRRAAEARLAASSMRSRRV